MGRPNIPVTTKSIFSTDVVLALLILMDLAAIATGRAHYR